MEQNSRGLPSSLRRVILVGQEPGTEFKEGPNIIRYKVYDHARNRAGCKFIVRIEGKLNALNLIYHLGAIIRFIFNIVSVLCTCWALLIQK